MEAWVFETPSNAKGLIITGPGGMESWFHMVIGPVLCGTRLGLMGLGHLQPGMGEAGVVSIESRALIKEVLDQNFWMAVGVKTQRSNHEELKQMDTSGTVSRSTGRDRRSQRLFISLPEVSYGQKTFSTTRATARFVTRLGGMERSDKRCIHF